MPRELPDRGTEVVKDQEWSEKHFPWCRYMRETVSFVRHREVNTLGLLSLRWTGASLLFSPKAYSPPALAVT